MHMEGNLLKMRSVLADPVQYHLPVGSGELFMNELIGKEIRFEYSGQINCIRCGNRTKTSFAQGYCYPCFLKAPETSECVLRPELCRAHEGISRDMEWSRHHCLQEHIVYLSVTSGIKVGVTRSSQVPTRWIDQGAWKAIRLAITPNRYTAGLIEVFLKKHLADKTNWRQMLKNELDTGIDLVNEKHRVLKLLPGELAEYLSEEDEVTELRYPVTGYPEKVKSIGFDKTPVIEGELTGIKGQYLIFKDGEVLNIRKHGGYYTGVII
jgi:hypothetical protein